jgi:nicotinamidase-related amidase
MTSISPARDPLADHLLTPQNSALIVIDYQPTQVNSIRSMDTAQLVHNIGVVVKTAKLFNVPIILSTVNVATKQNNDTIKALKELIPDVASYDRTTMNSWEDAEFLAAVKATGRKKLVMTALWTEVCLTLPTLDAIAEGFEVYPVVDAVGGTSKIAHKAALRRMEQAGAQLISTPQLICEYQRDWNRDSTKQGFVDLLFDDGAFIHV